MSQLGSGRARMNLYLLIPTVVFFPLPQRDTLYMFPEMPLIDHFSAFFHAETSPSLLLKTDHEQIYSLSWQDGEGNGIPLQYSCLENPMDRGSW